jgi:CRP-like cAMP-binding protein
MVGADDRIDQLCFLEAGVASYADLAPSGMRTGIGMTGFEGLVGWQALLGAERSSYEVKVAVGGGPAFLIEAGRLREACRESLTLQQHLTRFVQAFLMQLGQTAVSNLVNPVEKRLCRWLLMNHDRIQGDEIALTHNQIGEMLGIRRASVTDALHVLEGDGLIRADRRLITVRDRERLRRCAGEYYGRAEAEYSALIAPFGKG